MLNYKKNLEIIKNQKPQLETLKNNIRILVIDDEEVFPIKQMEAEGYDVTYWEKVKNLRQLETGVFEIIVLDIGNIAKDYSPDDGLGILVHIKKYNPTQLVIAFSGNSFDLSKQKFWKLADEFIAKPTNFLTCKEKIDSLLISNFTVGRYLSGLEEIILLNGGETKDYKKIEKIVLNSYKSGRSIDVEEVKKAVKNLSEIIPIIVGIIKIIGIIMGAA